jgi:hypothetical protein
VAGAFEQLSLLVKDNVFSPGLLIRVVDEEDLHFNGLGFIFGKVAGVLLGRKVNTWAFVT